MSSKIDYLAKLIWNYHHLNHKLKKADAIFVLCSHDILVAKKAAKLYLLGYAPFLIFSGGFGRLTKGIFKEPEAEVFADVALKMGVPKDKIIIENQSTNTGENILFTRKLLEVKSLIFNSFIVVQKPYMERRTYATFKKQWPDKKFIVTSPQLSFNEYTNGAIPKDEIINTMVGDLQRIKIYPKFGFQIYQKIPDQIWQAFEELVSLGFNKQLIYSK